MRNPFVDDYGLNLFGFACVFVTVLTAGVSILAIGIRSISIHYDKIECKSFSVNAGRETKFVTYNYWSWDCLTPTSDGKWIPTSNLREFADK